MSDPIIVMNAPNGARRNKNDHPLLPITPRDLADCAEAVLEAGASIFHMHVRNEEGGHSLDKQRYIEAMDAVRSRVGSDLILQITTEAVGVYSRQEQLDIVRELEPESVSLALREICPDDDQIEETRNFFNWMESKAIFPQIIVYDEVDLARLVRMKAKGAFGLSTPFILYVLGRYVDAKTPKLSIDFIKPMPGPWAVCGFGKGEYLASQIAAENGGHIRVGFENNIWQRDGDLVGSNADLVRDACSVAIRTGRKIATADNVREIFALRRYESLKGGAFIKTG
jgi:3-keto-5-aminohexanoate cleavage enzyme